MTDQPPSKATKRPLAVTIIGWVFIAAGVVGVAYHMTKLSLSDPLADDTLLVAGIRVLAVVGGAFLLRGHNWARWLLLAWLAFHIYVSAFHTHQGLAAHIVLLAAVGWFLLRPPAAGYFRKAI